MIRRAVVRLGLALVAACADPQRAHATLEAEGYTRIVITGGLVLACGGAASCTGFVAHAPGGRRVRGAVDCGDGWMGSCTVRIIP